MGNELKALVTCVIAFANAVGKSMEDGQVGMGDLLTFIKPLMTLSAALKGLPKAPAELVALDEAGRAELKAYIIENFSIPEAQVEQTIESGLAAAFAVWDVIAALMPKKPEALVAAEAPAPEAPQA